MPITLDIKKDVKEAVTEAIAPLLRKMDELENQIRGDDELIDIKEVRKIAGIKSDTTVYDKVKKGELPPSLKIGPKMTRWRKSEVLKYVKNPTLYKQ